MPPYEFQLAEPTLLARPAAGCCHALRDARQTFAAGAAVRAGEDSAALPSRFYQQ
ncbi:MAG: hypothetical protein QME13_00620 [Thermoanaerobacteraceae bacterium]|nr:hypothetical protein [Thermoanaerobacteraceae bacterium]